MFCKKFTGNIFQVAISLMKTRSLDDHQYGIKIFTFQLWIFVNVLQKKLRIRIF